jgi:hypothetical protein
MVVHLVAFTLGILKATCRVLPNAMKKAIVLTPGILDRLNREGSVLANHFFL